MFEEGVDDCLAALKFIPDSFVTSKMLEEFDKDLLANDCILFLNEDFNKVTYIANQKHIPAVGLDKINLDNDNNFNKMILILLSMLDFWLGIVKLKNAKHLKKDKQRINDYSWHPKRWWNVD